MLLKPLLYLSILSNILFSGNVDVISRDTFFVKDKLITLQYPFIVVSFKPYQKGFVYYVTQDKVLLRTEASGGSKNHETPFGLFSINYKKKYHMSTRYPSDNGVNNMDDMLNITKDGIALHKGNVNFLSHGCIHINSEYSRDLFNLSKKGLKVIITSDPYNRFL